MNNLYVRRTLYLRPKNRELYYRGRVPAGTLVRLLDEHPAGAMPGYVDVEVVGDPARATPAAGDRLRIDRGNRGDPAQLPKPLEPKG